MGLVSMLTTSTGCKMVALLGHHSGSILRLQDGRAAQVAQQKEGPGAAGVPHHTARAGGCVAHGGGRVKTGDASCHSDGVKLDVLIVWGTECSFFLTQCSFLLVAVSHTVVNCILLAVVGVA